MLTISEGIWAKVEATKGVDAVPTAADAVLVSGQSWKNEGLEMIERADEVGSGLGADRQALYGSNLKTVTFDWKARGSGAAGTAPEADALLRMCAMAVTNVPSTSDTYNPVSDFDTQETGTIYYLHKGIVHKMTGCVGTFTTTLETNGVVKFSFTVTGHDAEVADSSFTAGSYLTTKAPVVKGAAFTVGGYAASINSLAFDYGANISMPKDMNQTDGFGVMGITKFSPKGSFDPLMVTAATNDYLGDFKAGTNMALDTGVIGTTAGNRLQIQMPGIYYTDASPGDREGFRTYEIPYGATDSSGDDFVSLIFT